MISVILKAGMYYGSRSLPLTLAAVKFMNWQKRRGLGAESYCSGLPFVSIRGDAK
jgi:hypothetical protein